MVEISVIVPVYNCEEFLKDCVESVVSQKMPSCLTCEILLINDGSTDKSGEICDEFSRKFSFVRVFHTKNKGVSAARNKGVEESAGEWIVFLDADDVLDQGSFQLLYDISFFKYDVVRFGVFTLKKGGERNLLNARYSSSLEEYSRLVLERETILGVWGGIYSKKLFKDANITFLEDLKYGEDWLCLYTLLLYSSSFYYLNQCIYGYRFNENSATKKRQEHVEITTLIAYERMLSLARSKGVELKECSLNRVRFDLRRERKKKFFEIRTCSYLDELEVALNRYVPQSFLCDLKCCKNTKHVLLVVFFEVLYQMYRIYKFIKK